MGGQRESGPQLYRIRVCGRLGQTIRSAFPAFQARAEGGDTMLTGVLADQAALYGVLAEAEALGLELIEVRRLPLGEGYVGRQLDGRLCRGCVGVFGFDAGRAGSVEAAEAPLGVSARGRTAGGSTQWRRRATR